MYLVEDDQIKFVLITSPYEWLLVRAELEKICNSKYKIGMTKNIIFCI